MTLHYHLHNFHYHIHLIRDAFTYETSELPDEWTPERPSTGQCHVASLLLQREYGGDIMCGWVFDERGIWKHYWNVINGVTYDLTADQFTNIRTITILGNAADEQLLSVTRRKAQVLRKNYLKQVIKSRQNPEDYK